VIVKPGIDFPGVGAGLVIRRDGKVLLYKVDHMEHSRIAAIREAEEETGLSIGDVSFLCTSEQIIAADRQHWLSLIYMTDDFKGEPSLTEPDKLSEFGWFDVDNPPQPLSFFARDAFLQLRNARA
jgi:8-oxo-dGTP diphosphatase